MTDLLFNPVGVNLPSRPPGIGQVFFVDQINGANTNNGIDPGTPFATIDHALGQCAANNHDYIYVLWTLDGSEPAYPIVIDIAWVHLIGISGYPGPILYQNINGGGAACLQVTASGVEIAGFGFHTTGAAAEAFDMSTDPYAGWIHHCLFAGSNLAAGLANGIQGGAIPWWLIEDNTFSSSNGVGIVGGGILGNLTMTTVRRNVFTCCAGGATPCLQLGGVEIGAIIENYFVCPISDAGIVGWAITAVGALEGGPIANNHAMQTGDGTGLNPYRDLSTPGVIGTTTHAWGMNYSGQAVIAPATN